MHSVRRTWYFFLTIMVVVRRQTWGLKGTNLSHCKTQIRTNATGQTGYDTNSTHSCHTCGREHNKLIPFRKVSFPNYNFRSITLPNTLLISIQIFYHRKHKAKCKFPKPDSCIAYRLTISSCYVYPYTLHHRYDFFRYL